ncbi:ROBO2 [Lepeophtheirus salmonis]|uniref:ROBO2 n=1 Tax=Lepeophtheirus salmonis TaxID=72036 RepID=A0A7R8HCT8_LEPSM|nr:ROBO2 [Lepeophtheirus salmonis]CAF3017131.1 ROBO2 [Lepeophtheirus salmonis]
MRLKTIKPKFVRLVSQLYDWFPVLSSSSQSPPLILSHPESTIVPKNDPVTLRCDTSGDPLPEIIWRRNGRKVTTAADDHRSRRVLLPNGSLFFLRTVHSRKETDGGIYSCVARNTLGSVESRNASLTIAGEEHIILYEIINF